ncbi:outer membrane lipoprotein carrier protein LolA [Streptomyces glaucosporus]|uniref:Outer membrane lipoprotein carrier protein LolA n=1 Tax=Streptomyces glaucosporus TaxID=284044 RepID=A0ABN3IPD9_9ACTN
MAQTRSFKKALRYAVPATVAGAAAATVGLVPALATPGGDPDLPEISAQELVAKIAASDVQHLSGTVRITTDLGFPALSALGQDGYRGGEGRGGEKASEADPRGKLAELSSGSHTLRVAADGPDRQRVSIVEEAAEYSLIRNGEDVWAYDSASNTVHHTVLPEDAGREKAPEGLESITPQKAAAHVLKAVDETTSVTVDGTAKVAGQDAYQLLVRPKQSNSTVESVRITVDADSGVPLRFTLTPEDGGKAAIDVGYTQVDFSKPDAETFAFKPPKGAEITEERVDGAREGSAAAGGKEDRRGMPSGLKVIGEGWNSVAEIELPEGAADGVKAPEARDLLGSFTDEVKGEFGTGRLFKTRLVNALITDDGTVYVGAVTRDGLVEAANAAE